MYIHSNLMCHLLARREKCIYIGGKLTGEQTTLKPTYMLYTILIPYQQVYYVFQQGKGKGSERVVFEVEGTQTFFKNNVRGWRFQNATNNK